MYPFIEENCVAVSQLAHSHAQAYTQADYPQAYDGVGGDQGPVTARLSWCLCAECQEILGGLACLVVSALPAYDFVTSLVSL